VEEIVINIAKYDRAEFTQKCTSIVLMCKSNRW